MAAQSLILAARDSQVDRSLRPAKALAGVKKMFEENERELV